MSLEESLKKITDVAKAAVFTADGKVLASTFDVKAEEIPQWVKAFGNYDDAFRTGVTVSGEQFEVFRYYPDEKPGLIYGRTMPDEGEGTDGFVLLKTKISSGDDVYIVAVYSIPVLSPKAVPQLVQFAKEKLETM